jgi:calcineurin-like phosphoesterase
MTDGADDRFSTREFKLGIGNVWYRVSMQTFVERETPVVRPEQYQARVPGEVGTGWIYRYQDYREIN